MKRYVLGNTRKELSRLDIQSSLFEEETLHTLRLAGIKPGMRCLDLGCGTGSTTFLLARMVGRRGKVVGLDMNEDSIVLCRKKAGTLGFCNARFIVGNAFDTKLESRSFDFVFSRFLFQHLGNATKALREMLRVTAAGGIIAVEELDHSAWLTYPPEKSVEELRRVYVGLLKLSMSDPFVARKLYKLFLENELQTKVGAYSVCVPMGDNSYNMIGVMMAEVLKDSILENNLMSKARFDQMLAGLNRYAKKKDGLVLYALAFRLWGRKAR
jgi:ubiquinone/menaquinone biosynthesis C-methylase UbiE